MKFEEMAATNGNGSSSFKKNKSTIVSVFVFLVVLIAFFVIYYSFFGVKKEDKKPTIDNSTLTKNDLLVQTLYSRVHDFNKKNPLWMYRGESGSLVTNMTESTKMTLVYANMKTNDFIDVSCSNVPATISGYEDYTCSSSTKVIKLDNVSRVYRELFGKDTHVSTSAIMKKDNLSSGIFIYVEEINSYVLYTRKVTDNSNETTVYNYEIVNVVANSTDIKIYEKITSKSSSANNVTTNYVYTFKRDDVGNYIYYSRESI